MRFLAFALITIIASLSIVACGDDDGGGDVPTPSAAATVPVGGLFPQHLTSIAPENGATVTNEDLNVGDPDALESICAGFDFRVGETMGDQPLQRVQMFFNEENVTTSGTWIVTDDNPTSSGTMCYTPPAPLEGLQTVVMRWSNATAREFVYSWQFTVEG